MKTRKTIYYILMILPILYSLLSLSFLPDIVPAHFGANNVVNRWGSKYETLIFPVVILIFGVVMLKVAKFAEKKENSSVNNKKICEISSIIALIVFNVINAYILIISLKTITDLNTINIDFNQLVFITLSIGLLIIGNLMPKAKMNSIYGLRTPWSLKSEIIWKKSQLFGGITLMVTGVVIVIASIIFEGVLLYVICLSLLLLETICCVAYTHKISKD